MEFSYNGLWKILIDKGMLRKDLMEQAQITSSTVAKMGKNKPVSLTVIGKICTALDCEIEDVVSLVKTEN